MKDNRKFTRTVLKEASRYDKKIKYVEVLKDRRVIDIETEIVVNKDRLMKDIPEPGFYTLRANTCNGWNCKIGEPNKHCIEYKHVNENCAKYELIPVSKNRRLSVTVKEMCEVIAEKYRWNHRCVIISNKMGRHVSLDEIEEERLKQTKERSKYERL